MAFHSLNPVEQKKEMNRGFVLILLTEWMVRPFTENPNETNDFVPPNIGPGKLQVLVDLGQTYLDPPTERERKNMKLHVKSGHRETLSMNFNRMGHNLSK